MFYTIIIIWIFLDLFTKYLASIYFKDKIDLIWNFLYLEYIENSWIAFSIAIPLLILKILTIILIFGIFYYYLKEEAKKKSLIIDISFWLILAWAIWNGIERILNSRVIDFIWVTWFSVFNLADSFISIWAVLYILYYKK